ncbi:MAG: bifunctional aconitate hydratase 2/2-methylisocitrate dehydratase [Desulfobulbaceae bacterium S3730MH12]|nr:MAG: bifunctional aconitate hydratase 2/2-methylisocitrate dehydratase [Desulfobulbaceae bacterium S3730MH12]
MIETYREGVTRRAQSGLPPLPLNPIQVQELISMLDQGNPESGYLLDLLETRVEPGVSKSAREKARWLEEVALGNKTVLDFGPEKAVAMLGRMGGGYNVSTLIRLLGGDLAEVAAQGLKQTIKVYESFDEIVKLAKTNSQAKEVLQSWARAEWFEGGVTLPETMKFTIYKVEGEINTDDFSPGNQAQSRADIPLHATFFGYKRFPDGIKHIGDYRKQGNNIGFAGDVVGTGSSRKSAINSLVWHIGEEIPSIPNKKRGGVVLGGTIAPIFYATARDAGVLPLQCDVSGLDTGDEVVLDLVNWKLTTSDGREIPMEAPPVTLLDEYRAGGRLNLIIGRQLSHDACDVLGMEYPKFREVENPAPSPDQGFTLAQKMVGRACGVEGIIPGTVCQPKTSTVGSQDTTGPMTVQEIAELACLRFKTDLFMQSFCHTAAYPKAADFDRWETMTETAVSCGGVALKPGDGVIHSWLNKMLIPDSVGTGGDSHTRFPLGISFPAGSGLVAFAGALGFMPLEMPESVLVRFKGSRKPGITVRDMVNSIPFEAIRQGLLTVAKKGKKNIFAGTILEIEGIDDLTVEEAFELSDSSAERSAAACALALPLESVVSNVKANVRVLEQLVADGYEDSGCLQRRIAVLKEWLQNPTLLKRDESAEYRAVVEIDLAEITEPILACPNDPDDVKVLSEVAGTTIDEAFIGSCMTHLSHLRAAARLLEDGYAESRIWLAPSTRLDRDIIKREGSMSVFAQAGCRVEIPGCSLCMGNQARVRPGSTVISTSTRNFDNRLGDGTKVFLASTELTAISGMLGRIPGVEEYFQTYKSKSVKE